MQTVWSRSLRPQSSHQCLRRTKPRSHILSRRSTTGIFHKGLHAGDAFGLLLFPLLGGAYAADAKVKEERRDQWDKQIAAVKAEIERVHQSTGRYSTVSRSVRRLPGLARPYSTQALAPSPSFNDMLELDMIAPELETELNWMPQPSDALSQDAEPAELESKLEICHKIQRLIAIKLAIRMLLQMQLGSSPRYRPDSVGNSAHASYTTTANELVVHLKQVERKIHFYSPPDARLPWNQYHSKMRRKGSNQLDLNILELSSRLEGGRITINRLVQLVAQTILQSREAPSVHGYSPLLNFFARANFHELGRMVETLMTMGRVGLDDKAILLLLRRYGKERQAGALDKLLNLLTLQEARGRYGRRWNLERLNDTVVPMPPDRDPVLLSGLIYASLRCGQLHRAEAWAQQVLQSSAPPIVLSHLIRNFLNYFGGQRNWLKGHFWLTLALDRITDVADLRRHLQQVVYAMLHFSATNDDRVLYQRIMEAAVQARIGVYAAAPDLRLPALARKILQDWAYRHHHSPSDLEPSASLVERARLFRDRLSYLHNLDDADHEIQSRLYSGPASGGPIPYKTLSLSRKADTPCQKGIGDAQSDMPSTSFESDHWKELCRNQQEQLDTLRRQVMELQERSGPDAVGPSVPASPSHSPNVNKAQVNAKGDTFFEGAFQRCSPQVQGPTATSLQKSSSSQTYAIPQIKDFPLTLVDPIPSPTLAPPPPFSPPPPSLPPSPMTPSSQPKTPLSSSPSSVSSRIPPPPQPSAIEESTASIHKVRLPPLTSRSIMAEIDSMQTGEVEPAFPAIRRMDRRQLARVSEQEDMPIYTGARHLDLRLQEDAGEIQTKYPREWYIDLRHLWEGKEG